MFPRVMPVQSEDMMIPARADRLRRSGYDPVRFSAFVRALEHEPRQQLLWILDNAPGLFLQATEGSREAILLRQAGMTPQEKGAWEQEKARRIDEQKARLRQAAPGSD